MKTLMDALPVICRALGEKNGLRVVTGASVPTACTDGDTVWIPRLDLDSPGVRDLVVGYIDHEAGHVRSTDFKVNPGSLIPALRTLVQCFEDIRQETQMCLSFPGSKGNFNRLMAVVHERRLHGDPDAWTGFESVAFWAYNHLRAYRMGLSASVDFAERSRKVVDQNLPGLAEALLPLLDLVPNAEDTSEIVEIADSVLELMKERFPEDPPPPPAAQEGQEDEQTESDDEQPADEGSDDESDEQSDDEAEDQSDDEPEAQADDKSDDTTDASPGQPGDDEDDGATPESPSDQEAASDSEDPESEEDGDTDGDGQVQQPGAPNNDAAERMMAQQIRDEDAEFREIDIGDAVAEELKADPYDDEAINPLDWSTPHPTVRSLDASAVTVTTSRLRGQLGNLLQAATESSSFLGRRGRRVDDRQIHRLALKDPRVFVTREEVVDIDTYVHILVDGSGSMDYANGSGSPRRIEMAMAAAFASCLALESIHGVTRECTSFSSYNETVTKLCKTTDRAKPSMFAPMANCGTPLAEALMAIAPDVALNKSARKLVVVLTDGEPDCEVKAKKMIDLYTRSGVEMVGIGICTMAVTDLFPASQVIDDVSNLPAAFTKALGRVLVQRAA